MSYSEAARVEKVEQEFTRRQEQDFTKSDIEQLRNHISVQPSSCAPYLLSLTMASFFIISFIHFGSLAIYGYTSPDILNFVLATLLLLLVIPFTDFRTHPSSISVEAGGSATVKAAYCFVWCAFGSSACLASIATGSTSWDRITACWALVYSGIGLLMYRKTSNLRTAWGQSSRTNKADMA